MAEPLILYDEEVKPMKAKTVGKTALRVLGCGLLVVSGQALNSLIRLNAAGIENEVSESLERARIRRYMKNAA